jgi:hypothetical protein
MQTFQAGGSVTLQIPLTDENDNDVAPTAVAWRLLDDMENEIVAPAAISGPFGDFIDLVVPPTNNSLPAGSVIAARTVELIITTASETIYKRAAYGLVARQQLQILVNSFQTLTQAELEARYIVGLQGWMTASEEDKIAAMAEAYRRLTRIGYFVRWPRDPDAQNTVSWWNIRNTTIPARFWQFMKMDRYLTYYPEDFRAALRKAQVSEADVILSVDPAKSRRDDGIIKEEIGESRVTFRDSKPLDLGIAKRTLRFLDGYVNLRMTLTRS